MLGKIFVPFKSYRTFEKSVSAWIEFEALVEPEELKNLIECTINSAWAWLVEYGQLDEWNVEGNEFDNHALAALVRSTAEDLLSEVLEFTDKLGILYEDIQYFSVSFDNLVISYHKSRPINRVYLLVAPAPGSAMKPRRIQQWLKQR